MKNFLYLLLVGVIVSGCTSDSSSLSVDGRVYIKGSEPHTYVVIEDSSNHKKYKVVNPKDFDLKNRQRELVSVEAKVISPAKGALSPEEIEVLRVK
jgi:uncharacterized protein YcfL